MSEERTLGPPPESQPAPNPQPKPARKKKEKTSESARDPKWVEAKKRCRINQQDITWAKELGLGPVALMRNIPGPNELWKAPVKQWIHELYAKRFPDKYAAVMRKRHPDWEEPRDKPRPKPQPKPKSQSKPKPQPRQRPEPPPPAEPGADIIQDDPFGD